MTASLLSLAISVSLFGGLATWLFLTVGTLLIWAAFVAWACFFHTGGDRHAFRTTVICNVFGILVASVSALAIAGIPGGQFFGTTLWAALVVAVSIIVYIAASCAQAVSSIPSVTYGYACTFALLTQNTQKFTVASLTSLSIDNPFCLVSASMILGAVFAFASAYVARVLELNLAARFGNGVRRWNS